ncbi:MAG: hypothetical protein WKF79_15825 [Nocardioides sp.]
MDSPEHPEPGGRRGLSKSAAAQKQLTKGQEERARLRQLSLTELAREFGTDKAGEHLYTPHYERHLGHLRREEFTLLEIGIGGYDKTGHGGGSLKMWRWFFPRARVVGLDIADKSFVDTPRIRSVIGSQTDEVVLRRIVEEEGAPLVVIDDGSHIPADIITTFHLLFPLLPEGAIYVIEDTQTSYWPEWEGQVDLDATDTTMWLVKKLVDGLNYEEFVDDDYEPTYSDRNVVGLHCYHNLVLIEKGRNEEGSNKRRVLAERYADHDPPSD